MKLKVNRSIRPKSAAVNMYRYRRYFGVTNISEGDINPH